MKAQQRVKARLNKIAAAEAFYQNPRKPKRKALALSLSESESEESELEEFETEPNTKLILSDPNKDIITPYPKNNTAHRGTKTQIFCNNWDAGFSPYEPCGSKTEMEKFYKGKADTSL